MCRQENTLKLRGTKHVATKTLTLHAREDLGSIGMLSGPNYHNISDILPLELGQAPHPSAVDELLYIILLHTKQRCK